MTNNKYLDTKGMEERADAEFARKVEEGKERQRKIDEQAKKEQEGYDKLFQRAMLSEREENEKRRARELEEEKAKAMGKVETKYESKGIKSEHTKRIDKSFKSLLDNLPGLKD